MDLTFTGAQDAFRAELRAWLADNVDWDVAVGPPTLASLDEQVAFGRRWQARLAEGAWVGVWWPTEYGGRGLDATSHFIVQEELARVRAPELVGRIGVNLAGPTILTNGTDEQKARWLPSILDASRLWCQLFSEPGAGSDLAAVATRATRTEGGWLLTGQKVWTSWAQFADWGLCLARTNPDARKQAGITYVVVDMHADGIETRPLRQITDEADFNEVFLDGVFVPDENVIGEVDDGWRVARSTLSFERGVNPRQLVRHFQLLEQLLRLALERDAFEDVRHRQRLAAAYAEVRIFQLHNWRTLSRLERGEEPGPEGSALKLWWSQMSTRLHDTAMDILGPEAATWDDPSWQRSWLYYKASSIFGGTSEIQRTIVGERVLGLPRPPRKETAA
ncbi:MAG: acyl-CoA dehydrogenase family protein [Nitriliruptorales bacterium]|nr:acyl-CoA dehydrogenase family protein [Nitriliruptorales bacterium]